ncbi:MAG TPA: ATP-binding protein [Gemmatimonadaceae bacterium]|jgi:AAA+ ATPase superfamily predicted ATPase|nr:ATP-binding protein [Gemmatimonadaceae bacterium]
MPPSPSSKPAEIVDRDREWEALRTLWSSRKPELAFVVGRRRIGKSFLLGRFAREVEGLYYQATRRTEAEQLARLSHAIGEHFDDLALRQGVAFPDWEALLAYLTERAGKKPFLLVLDEFPYMSDAAPALPSILQDWWDHHWPSTRFKLVLSGSHITAMRQLEAAQQPLYGRRTRRLVLAPFGPHDVGAFVPDYDPVTRLESYGVIGGLPGNLSLLDPSLDLADNVAALLLDPAGRLVDEAQHMLDAFLGDAAVHYSIVEAVATGDHTWKGITNRTGRSGGSLTRPLEWLIDMQVITRTVPITEKDPRKSRRALYRVTDPYVAFWHRFVAPLAAVGSIGLVDPATLWHDAIASYIPDYMGSVFEEACRDAVRRALLVLPFTPVRVGEWWDATSTQQIDVVALGGDREMLVGECKWGSVTKEDLETLEQRAQLLATELGGVRRTHLALFSGSGRFDAGVKAAIKTGRVQGFTAADMV